MRFSANKHVKPCPQSYSISRCLAEFGIVAGFANSVIVRNVVFLCSYFGWQFNEFVQGRISLSNVWFLSHFYDKVTDSDWCAAQSLLDIKNIR